MTTYGLTAAGFVPKTYEVILAERTAAVTTAFGASLANGRKMQRFLAILSEREAIMWELAEAVYNADDPDAATGDRLRQLCALSGTIALEAEPSSVSIILTGTPGTVIATGSRVSVTSTGEEFETVADATLALASSWAGATVYAIGDIVTNAGHIYRAQTAGSTDPTLAPTHTSGTATVDAVDWLYIGEGTGYAVVLADSMTAGAIVGVAGDITTIVTPVGGWSSVYNLLDADLGRPDETDDELRQRREAELAARDATTAAEIRRALLAVDDVTQARVFINNTNVTDSDGVPAHTVEPVVRGGLDAAIREALWAVVAAGIGTHGTTSGTIVDSEGVTQTVKFSRPTEIPIYVRVDVEIDTDTFPADGIDQIKAAIVAWGDAQTTGKNAVASAIAARCFGVAGVLDVALCYIGTSDPPIASTTVAISLRQLATYDTSRIDVNLSAGTP